MNFTSKSAFSGKMKSPVISWMMHLPIRFLLAGVFNTGVSALPVVALPINVAVWICR